MSNTALAAAGGGAPAIAAPAYREGPVPRPATPLIPPAPHGVDLDPAEHARLVIRMTRGRTVYAANRGEGGQLTPRFIQFTSDGRAARNMLLEAYTPWIQSRATFGARRGQDRDDMGGQALLRAVEQLGYYEPARGVPLGVYLMAAHVITGDKMWAASTQLVNGTSTVSLDDAITADGDTRGDFVAAPTLQPDEAAEARMISPRLSQLLNEHLSGKQREALVAYLGLDGGGTRTVTELAADLGVSVPAAHERLSRALTNLRNSSFFADRTTLTH